MDELPIDPPPAVPEIVYVTVSLPCYSEGDSVFVRYGDLPPGQGQLEFSWDADGKPSVTFTPTILPPEEDDFEDPLEDENWADDEDECEWRPIEDASLISDSEQSQKWLDDMNERVRDAFK